MLNLEHLDIHVIQLPYLTWSTSRLVQIKIKTTKINELFYR